MTRPPASKITRRAVIGAALAAALPRAGAAAVIDKPARMVVGFPPGGSTDVMARLITSQMRDWAPSLLVDNRSGAAGRLGAENVKLSPPDGSVMLLTPASTHVIYPHIYHSLSYDPLRDFEPVTSVFSTAFTLAVGPMVPPDVKTPEDFAVWCRANPARSFYGSSGAGSMPHFAGVMAARSLGFEFTHVPFRGAAPAMQDMISGQIAANMAVIFNVLPLIEAGRARALATTGAARSHWLPDTPTFAELGYPDALAEEWFGVFMPSGTPAPLVARANESIRLALQMSEVKAAIERMAVEAVSQTPADFARIIHEDTEKWRAVVAATGFTMDD